MEEKNCFFFFSSGTLVEEEGQLGAFSLSELGGFHQCLAPEPSFGKLNV